MLQEDTSLTFKSFLSSNIDYTDKVTIPIDDSTVIMKNIYRKKCTTFT